MCSLKRIFLPNEYCQWEFLTGLSVLCAAPTWGKITDNGAASQLFGQVFQLQLLDSCDQHVAFTRGRKKMLPGFMVKNQDVKTQTENSRN